MNPPAAPALAPAPSFAEAFRVWLTIGLLSFGGPAGQIALMHRILVDEKRWISETRFLHALNYCMLLPGPEAQQLATYVGWLLHRRWGGLVAGTLFVLPGLLLMLGICLAYALFGELGWMQGLLFGMQTATLAVVVEAVLRVGRRALKHRALYAVAGAAFVAIFAFQLPFPLIVAGAAVLGLVGARHAPQIFATRGRNGDDAEEPIPAHAQPRRGRSARVLLVGALLWGLPILALWLTLGAQHVYTQEAVFFSKMAVVTFGGAYAVLAYMAQQAVEQFGWLSAPEMIQGLALAETTPGPLILVLVWVAFLGAFHHPGTLNPLTAGVLGGLLATWVSFVPCFLWIFLGAPYIEQLRGNRWLSAALTAITAAVVGVILNLSVWFAVHVLFGTVGEWQAGPLQLLAPELATLRLPALALGAFALLALLRFHLNLLLVLAICGVAGLGLRLAGLA